VTAILVAIGPRLGHTGVVTRPAEEAIDIAVKADVLRGSIVSVIDHRGETSFVSMTPKEAFEE